MAVGGFLAGIMSNAPAVQNEGAQNFGLTTEEVALFEEVEEISCSDDIDFAIPRITMENNENFYNLALAITSEEVQHYVSTNEEVVYEEGRLKSIFSSIKAAIMRAWQKVKGIFTKVFDTIAGWVKTDKKFVEKYEPIVKEFKGSVKADAYKFTNLTSDAEDIASKMGALDDVKSLMNWTDEEVETKIEALRGSTIGAGSVKSEDFGKALKKYFRNGETTKKEMTFSAAECATLISEIKDAKDAKKAAKASYAACEKTFKKLIADCKKNETAASKGMEKDEQAKLAKGVGRYTKVCNKGISISHTIMQAHIRAINDAHSQARSIVTKIVTASRGEKETPTATGESGMLEGFQLI